MRKQEKTKIEKSTVLRIIAFVLALTIAVLGFSMGVLNIGHKDEGYHEIKGEPVEDAVLYNIGVGFVHYFSGNSNGIKEQINALKSVYTSSLARAYKLVDAQTQYDGYVNLASINANIGADIQVSGELYDILLDAYEKTLEEKGFNMFAGAVYAAWDAILYLDEPEQFDPLLNDTEAERINRLAEETAKLDNFNLAVVNAEEHIIRIQVSKDYLALLAELESYAPIIDLNRLADAYKLNIVKKSVEDAGFTNGYLTTDSGLTVNLSGHEAGNYCFYGFDGAAPVACAFVPAEANSVCSQMRAFSMDDGEIGYYAIETDGETHYRHPNFSVKTGEITDTVMSCCAVSYDGNAADACYETMTFFAAGTPDEVREAALSLHGIDSAYTLSGSNGGKIFLAGFDRAEPANGGFPTVEIK